MVTKGLFEPRTPQKAYPNLAPPFAKPIEMLQLDNNKFLSIKEMEISMKKQFLSIITASLMLGGASQIKAMWAANSGITESYDQLQNLPVLSTEYHLGELVIHSPLRYSESVDAIGFAIALGTHNNAPCFGLYEEGAHYKQYLFQTVPLLRKKDSETNAQYNERVEKHFKVLSSYCRDVLIPARRAEARALASIGNASDELDQLDL
jgi:hypothetical protein